MVYLKSTLRSLIGLDTIENWPWENQGGMVVLTVWSRVVLENKDGRRVEQKYPLLEERNSGPKSPASLLAPLPLIFCLIQECYSDNTKIGGVQWMYVGGPGAMSLKFTNSYSSLSSRMKRMRGKAMRRVGRTPSEKKERYREQKMDNQVTKGN